MFSIHALREMSWGVYLEYLRGINLRRFNLIDSPEACRGKITPDDKKMGLW